MSSTAATTTDPHASSTGGHTASKAAAATTTTITAIHEQPPEAPHPHAMMTSDEVDALIHSYLQESGYTHTAFSLMHESSLAGPTSSSSSASTAINGRKSALNAILDHSIPPGHLVRILQKGLLYLEAEARYRGDPKEPSPRLIGYTIPNTMPLPPLPRVVHKLPTPTFPTATTTAASVPQCTTTPSTSSTIPPLQAPEPNTAAAAPRASAQATSLNKSEKAKGKEKESSGNSTSNLNGKRKGSDRYFAGSEAGKRPKMTAVDGASKRGPKANGVHADDAMEVDSASPAATMPTMKKNGHSASSTPRSVSPNVQRKPKSIQTGVDGVANPKKRPTSMSSTGAGSASVTSAPTSPSDTTATSDRRASLPETDKRSHAELVKIKAEDGGALDDSDDKKKKKRGLKPSNGPPHKSSSNDPAEVFPTVDTSRALKWSAEKGPVRLLQGHTIAKIQACTWNPKVPSLLATGAMDSTCRIWDVPSTRASLSSQHRDVLKDNIILKHSSAQRRVDVGAIAWDPSGSLLATGSEDGIARIWTASGDLHLVLSMHQRAIMSLQWNRLGTMLLTGSIDGTVCLWEISSGKVKQQWATHADSVLHLDWNDDQTFASASSDKTIHLFNVARTTPVYRFKGHRDDVNFVKFSPCGTFLASVSDDYSLRLWSLRNIPGFQIEESKAVVARDEERLIDGEDNGGQLVLDGHTADVHALAWSPSASARPRLVASASFDNTARLWDADTGVCLHTFALHSDWLYSIAFSPNGAFLATGSNDGKLLVWRVKDRSLHLEYTHTGPVYELAWKANGKQIAVCGKSHDVGVIDFDESKGGEGGAISVGKNTNSPSSS
ncbi:BQ2448_3556 [Microbotryum intermedium]|uniref:BQ2448_3556 protein n=1 Tax=Microbotryum intermedium TaxID=269621 RepID=A0A238FFY7_9BASI|nr:BQ2448_3556 [Microbotryum intermedium]